MFYQGMKYRKHYTNELGPRGASTLPSPYVAPPLPLLKQYFVSDVVGACHGLLCLFGLHRGYEKWMVVIWNPSIRKSFGIVVPNYSPRTQFQNDFGFGVCPITKDPMVVRILCADNMPWYVEVFTLSSGVWNVIPTSNMPRQTIRIDTSTQVVIDRFIYWGACDKIPTDNGEYITNHMVVSFDLITKEFKVVDLPDNLTNKLYASICVYVSKLRGSLVVSGYIIVLKKAIGIVMKEIGFGVWVMDHDSSFRKLFNVGASFYKLLGFRKNGEPIFEIRYNDGHSTTLHYYDPHSQQIKQIKNLGIYGVVNSFFMGSYKESLLLLDQSDLHIYCDDS